MEINEKLKNHRTSAGMTQERIAEELNVSRQTISNWENGKSLPDIISLIKISDLYQVSLDDLVKGDGKMLNKIKKDTDTVRSNQIMMNIGWVMLVLSLLCSAWSKNYDGGNWALQFLSGAAPGLAIGIGIACILAANVNKKRD